MRLHNLECYKDFDIKYTSSKLSDVIGVRYEKNLFFEKLENHGVRIEHRNLRKLAHLKFEFPVSIGRSTKYDFSIGRNSYMGTGRYNGLGKVGRYCSIANNVSIGLSEHPLSFLSTSPIFYDPEGALVHFQGDEIIEHFYEISEENVSIASDMYLNEHQTKKVIIGNDVWIGHGAFIKNGVNVGDGAVIAAHSVVTRDVPPYSIVSGVPARVMKYRFSEDIIKKLLDLKWWDYPLHMLSGINTIDVVSSVDKMLFLRGSGNYQPDDHIFYSIDKSSTNTQVFITRLK